MLNQKVVIIIPTYNESAMIEETLTSVFQATSMITEWDIHVLVFDSHSTDGTQKIVAHLQTVYPLLHLQIEHSKSGLGSAYLQAMHYSLTQLSADVVIEFDADLSHQPKYIALMLEKLKDYDVVVGSRYVSGGGIPSDWGWHRKLLSLVGNYIARIFLSTQFKDYTTGFRATRRSFLSKVLPKKFLSSQYAYKLELFWLLYKANARIFEYPIEFIDRQKGQSKLPANSIIDSLRVLSTLRLREHQRYIKMCLVGLTGVAVQCVLYNILRQWISPLNAAKWAVMAALINNFLLNNRFTFNRQESNRTYEKARMFIVYICYCTLMALLQSYWLFLWTNAFGFGVVRENFIMFLGIVIGSLLNYFMFKNVIWRFNSTT